LETEKTSIARLATDPVATWRAENANVTETDPSFEQVTFTAKSLACIVRVSRELLQDSVNVEQALMNAFAKSLGGELDRASLFGVAPLEPSGLVYFNGINLKDMGTNGAQITNYDPFLDVLQLIQEDNAEAPTAAIMAPRTATTLAKLKTGITSD